MSDVDALAALIDALIPVALDRIYEELKADVERLNILDIPRLSRETPAR